MLHPCEFEALAIDREQADLVVATGTVKQIARVQERVLERLVQQLAEVERPRLDHLAWLF